MYATLGKCGKLAVSTHLVPPLPPPAHGAPT